MSRPRAIRILPWKAGGAHVRLYLPATKLLEIIPGTMPGEGFPDSCTVSIDSYTQNSSPADTENLSRDYDLIVGGTATPDNTGISGVFSANGTNHPLSISQDGTDGWHTSVSKDWFPPSGGAGTLSITKQCGASLPATTIAILTFA